MRHIELKEVELIAEPCGIDVLASFKRVSCYKTVDGDYIAILDLDKKLELESLYCKITYANGKHRFVTLQKTKILLDVKYKLFTKC